MGAGPLVLITDSNLPSDADERLLTEAGIATVRLQARTADDVVAALSRISPDALIVQWAPITGAALDAAPGVRFISRLGIGYDMIDVDAATERGVAVANTPDYCVDEVVAHSLAMMLWLVRGLGRYDAAVRQGRWNAADPPPAVPPPATPQPAVPPPATPQPAVPPPAADPQPAPPPPAARRPADTVVGVVGLGRIGARVAEQARALGFAVLGCDPYAPLRAGERRTSLAELLSSCDLVTLHAPLDDHTRHLIRADTLAVMRPGALLVNTCRGGLIDEAAVIDALRSGRLAGVALDVFESEPLPSDSPLRSLPNVLLTPHAAWYSPQSLAELPVQAARQVIDFLAGRPVLSIVNPAYLDRVAQTRS